MDLNSIQGTGAVPPVAAMGTPPVVSTGAFAQQQHQPLAPRAGDPLSASQYPTYNNGTPPFFQSMNKRRGKWTAEEEDYALFIVREFEKGTLREAENGTTLRSFLSRKLHCQPMRISKKYAGKSIGKLVFLQKSDADEATLNAVDAQLRELELKFYKSLYDEVHPSQNGFRFHTLPGLPNMQAGSFVGGTYMPQPLMMAQTGVSALPMPIMMATTNTSPAAPQPIVVPHTAVPPPSNSSANSNIHTKNLQQTYLDALNQMIESSGQQQAVTSRQQRNAASSNGTTGTSNAAATTMAAPKAPPQAPIPALSRTDTSKGDQKTAPTSTAAPTATLQQKPTVPPGVKSAPSSDVPDFLSGFEKVSGNGDQRPPWMMPFAPLLQGFEGNGVPLQCSPPLTSKSFDDLHRLLGSDLSPKPLDLNNSSKTETTADLSNHTNGNASTTAATGQTQSVVANNLAARTLEAVASKNPADIYAAFAQQSALAVSQHYAYGQSGTNKPFAVANGAPVATASHQTSSASVVSHANLKAHATQQRKLQDQMVGPASKPKSDTQTSFPTSRIVSGSERSSEVSSAEDASSMHGSSSSNNGTSETGSNDSDSASDEGPPRKKVKMNGEQNATRNARDVISPISSDRSSPHQQ